MGTVLLDLSCGGRLLILSTGPCGMFIIFLSRKMTLNQSIARPRPCLSHPCRPCFYPPRPCPAFPPFLRLPLLAPPLPGPFTAGGDCVLRCRIIAAQVASAYKRVQAGNKSFNAILWKWEGKYAAPFYRQSSVFMTSKRFHLTTHHYFIHSCIKMLENMNTFFYIVINKAKVCIQVERHLLSLATRHVRCVRQYELHSHLQGMF